MIGFYQKEMKQDELNFLFHGCLYLENKEGYYIPRRFSREQMKELEGNVWFHDRTRCCASVTLELTTDAQKISFAYKFFLRTGVKSTFEIYVNGFLTHMIDDEQANDEGILEFSFKAGKKKIEIYLPNYSEVGIKDFVVEGEYLPIVSKKTKVLFLGDSITQGGGSERSGQTYVNVVKRILDYEILNQGIGGYYCDKAILKDLDFYPNKIVVAFGTNHRQFSEDEHKVIVKEFFKALNERYKDLSAMVVLPPYCGDGEANALKNTFKRIKQDFLSVISGYPNIKVVNAYHMIPHFSDYFMKDFLHPNALGMMEYGNNLVEEIKKNFT